MSEMRNLLVELQTEELPPKALKALSAAFAAGLAKSLRAQGVLPEGAAVRAVGTPRRLGAWLEGVLGRSADKPFRQKLVPVRVGIAPDGSATPALRKKLAALGISAEPADLVRQVEGKNEQLYYEGVKPGIELPQALQKALDEAVAALPIPKVMHYQLADGETTVEFVRPVRHLVALHGCDVVPVAKFGLQSGRTTAGHRFHTKGAVEIAGADAYAETMRAAHVVVDFAERRAEVEAKLRAAAAASGAEAILPEDLLDEVTSLTEWPVVYESSFEEEFLQVPEECLILTMQLNQKYFPLRGADGRLLNRFLLVSQLEAKDGGEAIREGNARVVRARLADAKFFYDQDRQATLESRVPGLVHVVYHNKLGTQSERVGRVAAIAARLARRVGADEAQAVRAATLAKADLRTLMVGEFPELQGIMGEYYARHDGEAADVALAIREHYQPRYAGDALPSTPVSLAVALADKLETLCGMFAIGNVPTGEKDPFALRRHALGVLRMLIEKRLALPLADLIRIGFDAVLGVAGTKDASAALATFFADRLRVMLRDMGYSAQEVDAVMAAAPATLESLPQRLAAVREFAGLPEATALAAANKRIGNILKKAGDAVGKTVDEALFAESAEGALLAALAAHEPAANQAFAEGRYTDMLCGLASLRAPVDDFFDKVMVNAEDPAVRANRLALLARLHALMNRFAELSRLA